MLVKREHEHHTATCGEHLPETDSDQRINYAQTYTILAGGIIIYTASMGAFLRHHCDLGGASSPSIAVATSELRRVSR